MNKTVIDIKDSLRYDTTMVSTIAPSLVVSESEKTPDWYYKNLMYFMSYYNTMTGFNGVNILGRDGVVKDQNSSFVNAERPIQKIIRMISYFLGEQPNLNYAHLVSNVDKMNMQATWIKGQDISEYVNYFAALIRTRLANAQFTARPLNESVHSEIEDMIDKLMLEHDMRPILEKMMKESGVAFNPVDDQQLKYKDEIKGFAETDDRVYKKYGAEIAENIANGTYYVNGWSQKAIQSFLHVVITSMGAIEHYAKDGKMMQRTRMPWEVLYDNRTDDDTGRYDQFRGIVTTMTPTELFSDYPIFSADQMREIERIANEPDDWGKYISSPAYGWWSNGVMNRGTVTVAKVWWKAPVDPGIKIYNNRHGAIRTKVTEEQTEYRLTELHQGILAGNRFLFEFGKPDNIVEDPMDNSQPLFPLFRIRPNTLLGESKSCVERVHKLQDNIDMLLFSINMMIGKAKGKVHYLRSEHFANSPQEFFDDISSMNVAIDKPSGEPGEAPTRASELMDMTLDPGMIQLNELYAQRKQEIGKILSTSDVALGQAAQYVGLGVQQNAINQGTMGITYLLDSFLDWVTANMRYSVVATWNMIAAGQSSNADLIVGTRGKYFINLDKVKELGFQDWLVKLSINDILTEKDKERYLAIAQAAAQNDKLDIIDYIRIDTSLNKRDMEKRLEDGMRKRKAEMEAMQLDQAKMGAMAGEQQSKLQLQLEKMADDTKVMVAMIQKAVAESKNLTEQAIAAAEARSALQETSLQGQIDHSLAVHQGAIDHSLTEHQGKVDLQKEKAKPKPKAAAK